jgi:hypothetical protein
MRKIFLIASMAFMANVGNTQKVGIGTQTPLARLHVLDGDFLVSASGPLNNNPGAPPVSGEGSRMMWYADKASFRAGLVTGSEWDKDNIGFSSFAAGSRTIAKGHYSTAFGYSTYANGYGSFAAGEGSQTPGDFSAAIGYLNYSAGSTSIALGRGSLALGYTTTAMGNSTSARGNSSTSMGYETAANGDYTLATGFWTTARAYNSVVFGRYNDSINTSNPTQWVASDPLLIIGNGTDEDNRRNALTVLKNGRVGIGTNAPQAEVDVNGTTTTNGLQVGSGNVISGIRFGSHSVGSSLTAQTTTTITFPVGAFVNTPRLIATIRHDPNWNVSDVFTVLVKSISTTQAVLIIRRIDANAAWSQNLMVDYVAIN